MLPLNKKAKKILESYKYDFNYPKDKDLKFWLRIEKGSFKLIDKPVFNMEISNYNYQKKQVLQTSLNL
jgi:hypothetical protein